MCDLQQEPCQCNNTYLKYQDTKTHTHTHSVTSCFCLKQDARNWVMLCFKGNVSCSNDG